MGHVIAGQWKPYQYLVESIRKFPCQVNKYNIILIKIQLLKTNIQLSD